MIAAVSWIPKGVCKPVPEAAEPPSKEEIEKLIKSGVLEERFFFVFVVVVFMFMHLFVFGF